MTYEAAVAHLYELGHELGAATTRKFDLAHMRALAAALQHPERRFASVLIAGTNGKGSTAATLASILRAAGYRTGLYTSPHLVRVNERIRINGEEISDPEFIEMYTRIHEVAQRLISAGELPHQPSFFETLTATALEYFASSAVDIAVLEVGMGGRLDATNIVEPCVSVITDISLDHQKFLGNTITEIAREKAGVIRTGGTVVTLPQHPEANDVIGNAILKREARAVNAAQYVPPVSPGAGEYFASVGPGGLTRSRRSSVGAQGSSPATVEAQSFSPKGGGLRASGALAPARNCYPMCVLGREIAVESPLIGRHQFRNIALAIAAAVELKQCGFPTTPEQIERGIRETTWPGRFQIIPAHEGWPDVVLDVAHNPAGAWALRSALSERFDGRPLVIVFGAMRDKAIGEMAEILFPLAECVIATQASAHNPRAATPEEIRQAASRLSTEILSEPSVSQALENARARATLPHNALLVITGSIYVVGEALPALESAAASVQSK